MLYIHSINFMEWIYSILCFLIRSSTSNFNSKQQWQGILQETFCSCSKQFTSTVNLCHFTFTYIPRDLFFPCIWSLFTWHSAYKLLTFGHHCFRFCSIVHYIRRTRRRNGLANIDVFVIGRNIDRGKVLNVISLHKQCFYRSHFRRIWMCWPRLSIRMIKQDDFSQRLKVPNDASFVKRWKSRHVVPHVSSLGSSLGILGALCSLHTQQHVLPQAAALPSSRHFHSRILEIRGKPFRVVFTRNWSGTFAMIV